MKKLAIFFVIIIIIVVGVAYLVIDYQNKQNKIKKENQFFESYIGKEISGTELATIINKATDNNFKNEVELDEKNNYINNDNNSIKIDIKMLDNDRTYSMETIYNNKIQNFVSYYGIITFKCTKVEYHESTGKIKYMLFEQITK
ncbi:MAG: hypothetical protein IJH76_03585 [Clostridia bacterium]|nr:hypothetical protein [Clostridia bacterium]